MGYIGDDSPIDSNQIKLQFNMPALICVYISIQMYLFYKYGIKTSSLQHIHTQ